METKTDITTIKKRTENIEKLLQTIVNTNGPASKEPTVHEGTVDIDFDH